MTWDPTRVIRFGGYDLETRCFRCQGLGKKGILETNEGIECKECNGTGYIPSQKGKAIISFFDKYMFSDIKKKLKGKKNEK